MNVRVGFAMTGSFCMLDKTLDRLPGLLEAGFELTPIVSEIVYATDTRFGTAEHFRTRLETLAGKPVLHTIPETEPIGPKKPFDLLIVAPCTGNTLGKLAGGITDTSVTMAAKAHVRNGLPLLLAVSTNDALGASARSIAVLLNTRNVYFVPMRQDDPVKKPTSMVADMDSILPAALAALEGRQIRPLYIT